jgi:hypothetical protein
MSRITITGLSGSEKGNTYHFDSTTVLLGSGQNCDISFNPQWDRTVDVSHARLAWREGRLWLEDAGSRNGVYLDGRKISREMVGPKSVVELGRNGPRLAVEAPDASPGAALPKQSTTKRRLAPVLATLAVIALLAAAGFVAVQMLPGSASLRQWNGDTDSRMQAVADSHREAVGLVVGAMKDSAFHVGTCWAVRDDLYVTNAHVAAPVEELMEAGGSAFVVVNERPDLKFRIREVVIHPDYGKDLVNAKGEDAKVGAYDIAIFRIEGTAPKIWNIAGREKLEKLSSGYRIGFLGFPMEMLVGEGVNPDSPVANMQSGIVTSTTDFWLGKSHYEERLLISHNLPATGGASGSPVFDMDGDVVGVLFGVNMIPDLEIDLETNTAKMRRIPNAALVNFAQRACIVSEMLEVLP